MRRASFAILPVAALLFCAPVLCASDPAQTDVELRTLRLMIEKQSLQIDALTQQVNRLNDLIEGPSHGKPSSASPTPAADQMTARETPTHAAATAQPTATGPVHVVTKGETLTAIAKQYKITVMELQQLNKIEDGRKLQVGQSLLIPAAKPEVPTQPKPETP